MELKENSSRIIYVCYELFSLEWQCRCRSQKKHEPIIHRGKMPPTSVGQTKRKIRGTCQLISKILNPMGSKMIPRNLRFRTSGKKKSDKHIES